MGYIEVYNNCFLNSLYNISTDRQTEHLQFYRQCKAILYLQHTLCLQEALCLQKKTIQRDKKSYSKLTEHV